MSDITAPTKNAVPHLEQGHTVAYSDVHDAYYCVECNEWLEAKCDDPDCEDCAERPDRPLP